MGLGLTKHENIRLKAKAGSWTTAERGDQIMELASKIPTLDGGKKKGLKSEIKSPKKKKRTRSQRHKAIKRVMDKLN